MFPSATPPAGVPVGVVAVDDGRGRRWLVHPRTGLSRWRRRLLVGLFVVFAAAALGLTARWGTRAFGLVAVSAVLDAVVVAPLLAQTRVTADRVVDVSAGGVRRVAWADVAGVHVVGDGPWYVVLERADGSGVRLRGSVRDSFGEAVALAGFLDRFRRA